MVTFGRLFIVAAMLFASGCGIDTNQPTAKTAQGSVAVATTAGVATTAAVGVTAPGAVGETAIADNFDGTSGIDRTIYPLGVGGGTPPLAGDGAAAFRMMCTAGQLLRDDPLFYPGQPGVSHLHQFMGNTGSNANSTYQSLRTSGGTTCGLSSTPFDRASYWWPAMLDGVGNVLKPDFIKLYYKRNSASDPMCSLSSPQHLGQCVGLPNGIRFAFGYNMQTGQSFNGWEIFYSCVASEDGTVSNGTATGRYKSIAEVAAAGCPIGAQLVIGANSPNCWDGVNLDTADHRSHMSDATGPYYAGQLFNACPADHPYVIPDVELLIQFTVDANLAKWHVSSDEMVPGAVNGSTMHVDFWEAWSPTVKATWQKYCIDGHLTCSSGDLGNGTYMLGADTPWPNGFPKHQLVPLSSIPGTTSSTPTAPAPAPPPPTTPTPTTQVCPDGSVIPLTQACPQPLPATKPGKGVGRKK